MRILLTILLLAGLASAQPVTLDMGGHQLAIKVDGVQAMTYVWEDEAIPRPYFCDVRAPNGVAITRTHPPDPVVDAGNDDHATFHPGIWMAFGDLSGVDFWRNKGRIRHAGFEREPVAYDGRAQFTVRNIYETLDDPPRKICEAEVRYIFRVTEHGYLLTCDASFFPAYETLTFGDQEEMGFGLRLATPLTVKHGAGKMRNSDGAINEAGAWGKVAAWCAGAATVEDFAVGAVVMPAPDSFRPSWFHVRDYGLIVANPFGRKAMTGANDASVAPLQTRFRDSRTLRFGVGLFSTKDDLNDVVAGLYKAYVK